MMHRIGITTTFANKPGKMHIDCFGNAATPIGMWG